MKAQQLKPFLKSLFPVHLSTWVVPPGTPNEVGHVAVFLASEEASYVSGQLIVVDGGNTVQEYKVEL